MLAGRSMIRQMGRGQMATRRGMSSAVEAPVKSSGSGLGVRVGAFLMGTGVGFGTANYIIYEELKESNLHIYAHLRKLEEEIQKKK